MPTITAIKAQAKRPDRYSIFIDGRYAFSLSEFQLAESGLIKGQDLDEDRVEELQGTSRYGKALQSAYRLLSYRSRSHKEITDRLKRLGYDQEVIAKVTAHLVDLKLINDDAFATAWLGQPKSKQRSLRRLSQDLRSKGVDANLIELAIGESAVDHDRQAIKSIIEKRLLKNAPTDYQKLVGHLVRQGFKPSLVLEVLKQDFSEIHWPQ